MATNCKRSFPNTGGLFRIRDDSWCRKRFTEVNVLNRLVLLQVTGGSVKKRWIVLHLLGFGARLPQLACTRNNLDGVARPSYCMAFGCIIG